MQSGRWGFGYPDTNHNFTTTGSSQQTAAFHAQTVVVRIACNQAVRVAFGSNPTATSTSMLITGGAVEYFITRGGHKVAVIQDSTAGACTVTEMTA